MGLFKLFIATFFLGLRTWPCKVESEWGKIERIKKPQNPLTSITFRFASFRFQFRVSSVSEWLTSPLHRLGWCSFTV
jgi:hypothetical protein